MSESIDPDVVIALDPAAASVRHLLRDPIQTPIIQPGTGMLPDAVLINDTDLLVIATSGGATPMTRDAVARRLPKGSQEIEQVSHRCIVSDCIELRVDPYQRDTRLEGIERLRERLPDGWVASNTTHLSTRLRAGFRTTSNPLPNGGQLSLVGIGETQAMLGVGTDDTPTQAATVDMYTNGAASVEEVDPAEFGLRGIRGVGESRVRTLRQAGYTSIEDVVGAPPEKLADLPDLGRSTAITIQTAAAARANGTIVATEDASLPYGAPIFIDIETDGLEPSTAWLIGVLDGDAENGDYLAFRAATPDDGAHLEGFMTWLTGSAINRPVVAWNGYNFDFPVIEDQLRQHCPSYLDAWEDTYCFDALTWARENTVLPGRNNKLETVAEALGWESQTTGIDGAIVGELYSAYQREWFAAPDPTDVTELDWTRLEAYCEDDVRALATIYEALDEAARRETNGFSASETRSTQGSLSDFT